MSPQTYDQDSQGKASLSLSLEIRATQVLAKLVEFSPWCPIYLHTNILLVNLRFDFQPAVVAFPNTPQDISEILTVGVENNLQVVARSGGVRL